MSTPIPDQIPPLHPPFATVAQVIVRAGEVFYEATDEDLAQASIFLDIVSAQVRHYGSPWPDPILAPPIAWAITIEAAARGYLNPAGYDLERGDTLTLHRNDIFAAGGILTAAEIAVLRSVSGKTGFASVLGIRDVVVSNTVTTGGLEDAQLRSS